MPRLTDSETISEARVTRRIGWLAIAQRIIDSCSAEAKDVSGLSLTQSRILFHLAVYPGKMTASIAKSLNLRITTASSALEIICEKGYAERRYSAEANRRNTQYFLTERGYAQLPLYIGGFDNVFSRFGDIVGVATLQETLEALLPNGTISMVETSTDDNTLQPSDIYQRLKVPEQLDPEGDLFDKAMYIEKIAWSLEEIDLNDTLGLTRKERIVLRALADLGNSAEVRTIRKCLIMKPPAASSALRGLQKHGYVTRIGDPENRRVVIASLTKSGIRDEQRTRESFNTLFDTCFPGFAQRPLPQVSVE